MLSKYKIWAYGYLVKVGRYDLEPVVESTKTVVPEDYRLVVAEFLATGNLPA